MTTVKLPPGICMKRLAPLFGLSAAGIYAAIGNDRFPIPTYRHGNGRYACRKTVESFFAAKRIEGLAALGRPTKATTGKLR
jgi:hypothetical protein